MRFDRCVLQHLVEAGVRDFQSEHVVGQDPDVFTERLHLRSLDSEEFARTVKLPNA
jgi:hypothetical protein